MTDLDQQQRQVSDSVLRGLEHHRESTRQAREWLAYCESAVAYYEEWVRTGEPPSRPFPSYAQQAAS